MLLNQNKDRIYDSIRQEWLVATPEEIIRQKLVSILTEHLGFPESLIALEKSLKDLPHVDSAPNRRLDILCYHKNSAEELTPLLLIECKAVPITEAVLEQVKGYNDYVKAPFICVANAEEVRTGYWNEATSSYHYIEGIPTYKEMTEN